VSRSDWAGADTGRPLSRKGARQSQLLVARLLELKPARIVSSPYLRCLQTVAPLALAAGVQVEEERRLAEGYGRAALDLVRSLSVAGDDAVLCSHGDVIPDVLAALANEDRVDLGPAPRVEKGSAWLLEGEGGRFSTAGYLPPPKSG
jgi:8-oxo-(d)GTP phosphatase